MQNSDPIWDVIVEEAQQAAVEEPVLEAFFRASVLNHASLDGALSYNLAEQLGSPAVPAATIAEVIAQALREDGYAVDEASDGEEGLY